MPRAPLQIGNRNHSLEQRSGDGAWYALLMSQLRWQHLFEVLARCFAILWGIEVAPEHACCGPQGKVPAQLPAPFHAGFCHCCAGCYAFPHLRQIFLRFAD